MPAAFMGQEKLAIAMKNTVIVGHVMFVVIPVKGKVELVEAEIVCGPPRNALLSPACRSVRSPWQKPPKWFLI